VEAVRGMPGLVAGGGGSGFMAMLCVRGIVSTRERRHEDDANATRTRGAGEVRVTPGPDWKVMAMEGRGFEGGGG